MIGSGYRIHHGDGNHRYTSMTRFIPFILILPTLLVTDSSVARPLVESPNFVETLCRDVSMERRERRKAGRAGVDRHPDRRVLDSAMEQYLVLIEALGKRGRRIEGSTGSRFLLAAVTLHEGLPEIENLFAEFADGQLPESTSSEIRPLLIEFTRSVRAGLSRLPNSASDDPEPVIVSILDPLNRASELASGVKTPSGWWDSDSDAALRASSQSSSASQSISDLDIDDELRSELRSLPERSSLRIASIELCIQLEASTWLNGGVRRDLSSLLVADLRNTRLDQGSQEELERRIAAIRLLIRAFDGLSTSSGGRAVARKGSESMLDLLEPWPDRLPSAETTIVLAGVVETLASIRDRESTGLEGEEARIHARISKQCLLAERRVFDSFADIARTDSPWTDPGAVVVLGEPRNLLEALVWLHELDSWKMRLREIDQSQSQRLVAGLRGLISSMVDQDTREDARRALREFERQLDMFTPLDQANDYLDARHLPGIANAWSEWSRDWASGRSAGDAGQFLFNYRRLLDHQRLVESTDRDSIERVDGWSAWELPIDHILERRDLFKEMMARLADSIESGDLSETNRIASELEYPFSGLRLVGAIADRAPDHSRHHPAAITIGEIAIAPSHDGLLMEERSRLASITHALLEIQFLESQQRDREAQSLQEWVQREMLRLNRRMGLVPARPLAVPGMREEATRIGVDGMQMMQ